MECPHCGERIQKDATKCKYCREWLSVRSDSSKPLQCQSSVKEFSVSRCWKKVILGGLLAWYAVWSSIFFLGSNGEMIGQFWLAVVYWLFVYGVAKENFKTGVYGCIIAASVMSIFYYFSAYLQTDEPRTQGETIGSMVRHAFIAYLAYSERKRVKLKQENMVKAGDEGV